MAAGQVAFHNERAVRRVTVGERDKELLARLAKTREESQPDLAKVRCGALRRGGGAARWGQGLGTRARVPLPTQRLGLSHAHLLTHPHARPQRALTPLRSMRSGMPWSAACKRACKRRALLQSA